MNAEALLQEISAFCRQTGMAESTFGRRAVNDGKLVSRLRFGGRITTETAERVRSFIRGDTPAVQPAARSGNGAQPARPLSLPMGSLPLGALPMSAPGFRPAPVPQAPLRAPAKLEKHFRFYYNQQKY